MASIWITVAQNSCAKIFAMDTPRAPLREIHDFIEPEARMHEQELTSDLPGKAFDGKGQGSHVLATTNSHKDQATLHFAKLVSKELEAGRLAGAFDKLIVLAAPAFLGLLRKNITDATKAYIIKEIDKNLVHQDSRALREYLRECCPREFLAEERPL